ncbi:MAG TPA: hypothetical protein VK699_19420 [Terriglobales bacterium]|nr:hypothetical protein [Terriglobales bacterium]
MTLEPDSQESVHDLLPQDDAPAEAVAPSPGTERPAGQGTLPAVQTPNLSEVYAQAGVRVPAHGFTILKIAEMLSSVHIRELPPDAKRAAVLLTLEASNIQVNEVTEDAARRERVLNDYEARQLQIFQNYKTGKAQQSQEAQAEIERLIEQLRLLLQANEKEVASEKNRLDEWRTRKREEERKIRTAASLFAPTLAQQPANDTITIPQVPQPDAPAAASAGNRSPAASPSTDNSAGKSSTRPSLWKR